MYLQALPYFDHLEGDCKVIERTPPKWGCCRNPWQSRNDLLTCTIWWWQQHVVERENLEQPTLGLISNRILQSRSNRQITFYAENALIKEYAGVRSFSSLGILLWCFFNCNVQVSGCDASFLVQFMCGFLQFCMSICDACVTCNLITDINLDLYFFL